MATLHLVAFPPSRTDLLAQVAACLTPGDDIVLLEAGTLIVTDSAALGWFRSARCHVLKDEVAAIGIQVPEDIAVIDWPALIALSESHPRNLSWWP